jgi:rSAM/selenodomain-associated transferase 1
MEEPRKLLLIFVKNPQLGKVKTRLARTVGDKKALEVYLQLLNHTVYITKDVQVDKAVFYADFIDWADIWPNELYQKQLQQGHDLGQRMQQAFEWAFRQSYAQIVITGSDCPQLTTAIIQQAYEALRTHQVVIGPAADGGYYLLGMNSLIPDLFADKKWSSPTVLSSTLADLHRLQIPYFTLPTLHDIDQEEDLYLLKGEFPDLGQNK